MHDLQNKKARSMGGPTARRRRASIGNSGERKTEKEAGPAYFDGKAKL